MSKSDKQCLPAINYVYRVINSVFRNYWANGNLADWRRGKVGGNAHAW